MHHALLSIQTSVLIFYKKMPNWDLINSQFGMHFSVFRRDPSVIRFGTKTVPIHHHQRGTPAANPAQHDILEIRGNRLSDYDLGILLQGANTQPAYQQQFWAAPFSFRVWLRALNLFWTDSMKQF